MKVFLYNGSHALPLEGLLLKWLPTQGFPETAPKNRVFLTRKEFGRGTQGNDCETSKWPAPTTTSSIASPFLRPSFPHICDNRVQRVQGKIALETLKR